MRILWLTLLQVILLYQIEQVHTTWKHCPITLPKNDLSMGGLVAISLNVTDYKNITREKVTVAIGVMIDADRVLTTYNPFRSFINNQSILDLLIVTVFEGRIRNKTGDFEFHVTRHHVACGRQVQYLPDKDIPDNLWHGNDRQNCPLHDLMILRLKAKFELNYELTKYTIDKYPNGVETSLKPGVFWTDIATPDDNMESTFKFGSLGKQLEPNGSSVDIFVADFDSEDNAITNCDEWLPREWGRFICIANKRNFKGLETSAMLFSGNKLFGVGSFALWRNDEGILVFTDVRYYYENIQNACTYEDSNEEEPSTFPPSLTW